MEYITSDSEKVQRYTDVIRSEGWVFAPCLANDGVILDGNHRYAAGVAAGLDDIPVVEMRDIVRDWDSLVEECGGIDDAFNEVMVGDLADEYGYQF